MFAIVDRTQLCDHLTGELVRRGVSTEGVRQLLAGDIVSNFGDRNALARIAKAHGIAQDIQGQVAVDPSDPSGNTIYVATAGGGVWRISRLGILQFSSGLPVTDAQDRQRLTQIFAAALA